MPEIVREKLIGYPGEPEDGRRVALENIYIDGELWEVSTRLVRSTLETCIFYKGQHRDDAVNNSRKVEEYENREEALIGHNKYVEAVVAGEGPSLLEYPEFDNLFDFLKMAFETVDDLSYLAKFGPSEPISIKGPETVTNRGVVLSGEDR